MKRLAITCFFLYIVTFSCSWDFFTHQLINRMAVFTLPKEMLRFYKGNISYISDHAVDADKRRYADTAEAARHYIDADRYGLAPFDNLPQKWLPAVARYSEKTLKEKPYARKLKNDPSTSSDSKRISNCYPTTTKTS